MNSCKRILIALCMILLLSAAVYAEDSQSLTNEWFGADAAQGNLLGIESIVPENPQISVLLDQFFSLREADFGARSNTMLYSGAENEAVLAAPQLQSAVGSTHQELIDALAERIDANILGATVTTFVESIAETETGYEAKVYEWTFFDYDDLSDGIGGSDTAGFGTEHIITFAYDAEGQLQILSDDYAESDVLTGELPKENLQEEELSADQKLSGYYTDYDPVKAAIYSNNYVNPTPLPDGVAADTSYYNPAYPHYAGQGGDCANFVSQCLYAGGFPTSGSWKSGTFAWINCVYQINYFRSYGTYVANPTEEDIRPGSLIYFNYYPSLNGAWYHVIICVGQNSAGTPVINGHTYDRYRVPWNYSKESYIATLQLTSYTIQDMTFTADKLFVPVASTIPLYANHQSASSTASLKLEAGGTYDVITTFYLNGTQWAAINYNGTVMYAKIQGNTALKSQVLESTISVPASATTNDILTVSVSPDAVNLQSWTITLTDAAGTARSITGTTGKARAEFDCQDMKPGTLTIQYSAKDTTLGVLFSQTKITLKEAKTVSGSCGDSAAWTLNKTTGRLTICGSGDVTSAPWLRFSGKITSVVVYPQITALPDDAFSGCTVSAIYGQPDFLKETAAGIDADYVALREFADVFPGQWYYDQVYATYDRKLFSGESAEEFAPLDSMTRGMMIAVLGRLAAVDSEEYRNVTTPFTDVPNDYYTSYVAWAYTTGITAGTSDTTFEPLRRVTREEAAAFLTRYLECVQVKLPDCENPPNSYSDAASISDYAVSYIQEMTRCGIMSGDTNGTCRPKASITRAEAASMFARLAAKLEEYNTPEPDPEPSETSAQPSPSAPAADAA